MHFSFFQRACQQDSLVVESLVIHTLYSAQRSFHTCKIFAWFIGNISFRVRLHREGAEYPAVQTVCETLSFPRGW